MTPEPGKEIHVPHVKELDRNYLQLTAPSREKGKVYKVTFFPSGKRHCECLGHYWFMKGKGYDKFCRHCKMSTIFKSVSGDIFGEFRNALKILGNKKTDMPVAWSFVHCQFPEHYVEGTVHCQRCSLDPDVCNIHPIKYGPRILRKPLIWKLQTAILNGRRKESKRIIRKIIKTIEGKLPRGCRTCHGRGYIGNSMECPSCHLNRR